MNPPRPGRSYWICQIAGWGSFTAYVLGGYIFAVSPRHAWDYFSIVFSNAVLCPLISHELRRQLYRRGWLQRPLRHVVPTLAAITVAVAATLTASVWLGARLVLHLAFDPVAGLGVFFGFTWAFTGWLVIYLSVHGRRRREALQLELAVVSREAQLRALRAQVNPHFLFNSLNSLRHLILANPERAVAMVTGLADLLRYSLASDRVDTVPLADELSIVDEYLDLEQARLEERLQVQRAIEPAALTVRVPPMLVQSLVDNAIKHGVAKLPRGGVVRVSARVVGAAVELAVANSGVLTTGNAGGSGLTNARERLRLLYDGHATLTLWQEGTMTIAGVRIPTATTPEAGAAAQVDSKASLQ